MGVFTILFYLIAAVIIVTTILAVTRTHMVHAVLYLVLSFLATALLFYLLGAPLVAAFEVIISAGAIMVLFLFIVMMIKVDSGGEKTPSRFYYFAAGGVCLVYGAACLSLTLVSAPGAAQPMAAAVALPAALGEYLFRRHWLAVELVSLLLLIVLVGVLHLGLSRAKPDDGGAE